ncbi:hypothetical protein [Legionella resiliens]|uniref:Uncharacterized protein n=1 Tax=Legionella resiliens TaxID=2905958 RepID=A0ABS8XAR4_9GAMM|nr:MULTISPECIES: hypothetical protein [unclassified Legionella]MCE0724141.1 hypothetical protein [Legionella sp. 9fVS26]MCE3533294.1 hypothetical protein [Legionella sp. 8cVS16]
MAEKLAIKSYQEYSESYFSQISQDIEASLLAKDWDSASWWRQIIHALSFGFFRVKRVTTVDNIDISLNFNDQEFRTHFIQLEFLPATILDSLGATEANNFNDYFQTHLDEIRALNDPASNSEEEEIDVSEKKKDPTEEETSAPLPQKGADKKDEESLSTETMVIKNNSTKKSGDAKSPPKTPAEAEPPTDEESPGKQQKLLLQPIKNLSIRKKRLLTLQKTIDFSQNLPRAPKMTILRLRKDRYVESALRSLEGRREGITLMLRIFLGKHQKKM